MEEGKRAWTKGEKKNAGSAEIGGFRRQAGVNLSTFSPAPYSVIPGLVSD
jgi:hypothetical protein